MSLMSRTWLVRCLSTNIFDAPATVFLHVYEQANQNQAVHDATRAKKKEGTRHLKKLLTRSSAARRRPMPAASSARARRARAFLAEAVGRSRPVDPPMLRRRLGAASSMPVTPAAADAPESRAESPDATRRDERLRLRRGGVAAARGASGSANLRRSSSEDALPTCCTDTCCGCCFCGGGVAIDGCQWKEKGRQADGDESKHQAVRRPASAEGRRAGCLGRVVVGCGEESGGRSRRI